MRTCAFCGGAANSREHAWPDWLLALFRDGTDGTIVSERDGEPALEWWGRDASVKVKRVCIGCNTGWMSRLEDEARPLLSPLIHGRLVELTGPQQLVVATWAVKTAIVFDGTRTSDQVYFSQQERNYLFEARSNGGLAPPFPPHTFVWLATYDGNLPITAAASVLLGVRDVAGKQVPFHGHVATISAGAFVTQVLVLRLPPEDASQPTIPHDAADAKWERAAVMIWPLLSGRARLPPQEFLDDGAMSLDDFALRWPLQSTKARRPH